MNSAAIWPLRMLLTLALVAAVGLLSGCRQPRTADVELRRINQELRERLLAIETENVQLRSDIRRLEADAPVVETLPQERLETLFTVAGIRFGRLTGRQRLDDGREGLRVYLQPFDEERDTLKAAGEIVIEAYDLAAPEGDIRIARWEFSVEEARRRWTRAGLLNEYVLDCPWPEGIDVPRRRILMRAAFTDALTGRTFEATREL